MYFQRLQQRIIASTNPGNTYIFEELNHNKIAKPANQDKELFHNTVDQEIFARDNFGVLNSRPFSFHHLAKWPKFFTLYT